MDYAIEINKMLEGALENDTKKVIAYAELLATNLEKDGDLRGASKIRKRLDGSYKNRENIITYDSINKNNR